MPTPARLATSAIGADGFATNTSRAASRINSSLRAACARLPEASIEWKPYWNGSFRSVIVAERNDSFRHLQRKDPHGHEAGSRAGAGHRRRPGEGLLRATR